MKKSIIVIQCLFIFIVFSSFTNQEKKKPIRPNIVILFADDLGWVDVSTGQTNEGRGSKIYETPHIDQLAKEGMSFTNAYTQQNCAPTRAALISGQYATGPDNGVYNVNSLSRATKATKNVSEMTIQPHEQLKVISEFGVTIFDMLKTKGYYTSLIGKSHGTPSNLEGDYGIDLPAAIQNSFKAKVNGKQVSSYYLALKDDKKGWTFNATYADKYAQPYNEDYIKKVLAPFGKQSNTAILAGTPKHLTDAIGDFAVDFIKEHSKTENPFLLYVPFHAVHTDVVARKDLTEKYLKKGLIANTAEYAALIELLDQNIGKIKNALKDPNGDGDFLDDISSNTLFIVYSDNGGLKINAPLTGGKGVFYEGGIRVPLICKWPGIIASNTISNQAVHCIDFYPTLAEVAGVDVSSLKKPNGDTLQLDGVSFAKILTGEQKRLNRDDLFWHFPGYMDTRLRPTSVIQKRFGNEYYKLFYYYETDNYALYHLNSDISEKNNLLKKPSAKEMEIATQMNINLITWLESNNAPTGTWIKDGTKVPFPKSEGLLKYK